MELLQSWIEELKHQSTRMGELDEQLGGPGPVGGGSLERSKCTKELRRLMMEVRATPDELAGWIRVLDHRQANYQQLRQELAAANLRLVISVAKVTAVRGCRLPT